MKVRRIEDVGKWLKRLEKRDSVDAQVPQEIINILSTSTFFVYAPKPDYESQATLFSFANEI